MLPKNTPTIDPVAAGRKKALLKFNSFRIRGGDHIGVEVAYHRSQSYTNHEKGYRKPVKADARGFYRCNFKPFRHLDRKSTRLNSSHVAISYAVFCLKK